MTRQLAGLIAVFLIAGNGRLSAQEPEAPPAPTLPVAESYLKAGLSYRSIGPARGGRVTAVAGHRAQPSTFYMGATGGGVWKTTDYGILWKNVSDGYFASPSIGAIRVADSDPNVVYVGTGSDGLRSNVIIGKGVYKSTDAGASWTHVGLEETGAIGAVLIHPYDPNLVYVAAIGNPFAPNPERGVFRTRDGGRSWEKVLYVSDRTGAVDLEFAPDNAREIYATLWRAERKPWTIISGGTEGGVYKSSDGGDTWAPLTKGLPTGLRGKADLAVSPADPQRVYVLIEAPGAEGGLYRSDDRGASWTQVTDFQPIRNRPFYYTNLEAHPKNADILWGMAEGHWKSEDAGKTWVAQRVPHGDNHDLWINPDNPDVMIQSNDGGANVSLDGGKTWSTQHNQPTAELYQVDVDDAFPYRLYAGQQDNTTISVPSLPARYVPGGRVALWEAHGGCETGPAVPKPGDPDIVYADCKGRFGVYNARTGQEQQYYVGFENLYGTNPKDLKFRFQRVAPIHVSPHDPNRVYHGSQFVHVTDDGGKTWRTISPDLTAFTPETQVVSGEPITVDGTGEEHFSVLYEIQESALEKGVVWTGANDGPINVTRDGGATWTNVTPKDLGPYGRVQTIETSPHRKGKAYASILRYQIGDFAPYAYKTEDYGATWTKITSGLPADFPVRVVREDPARPGLLYAGTEFGMFVSFDDGARWQPLQLDLPRTPVTDIKRVGNDLVLSTMGRGFYVLYDVSPLHRLSDAVLGAEVHLVESRPAHRLYGFDFEEFRREREPADPDYPAAGVNIHYSLAHDLAAELRLEILDATGRVVQTFSSEAAGERDEPASPGMREPRRETQGAPRLATTAGLHRFVWNLRHPGPWDPSPRRSGRRGPMVEPGTYTARLSVGSFSQIASFEVRMDPRVEKEGITAADVAAQTELALQARDALTQARKLAADIAEALKTEADPDKRSRLSAARDALTTAAVRYSRPMLVDQLEYLYTNLIRADQRPGQDVYERFTELSALLAEQLKALEEPKKPARRR
jgi:photosystem II stability/assembly factor-like uncharacterized protein